MSFVESNGYLASAYGAVVGIFVSVGFGAGLFLMLFVMFSVIDWFLIHARRKKQERLDYLLNRIGWVLVFVGLLVAFIHSGRAQEAQPQPTVADMQAALSEANAQASINGARAQSLAANLAHANAEIARLRSEIDKAKEPKPEQPK